ncbi:unnamed protein product [Urochloa humidicola]
MEKMEDMMEKMKLSEAEKKGVRVERTVTVGAKAPCPQAIGKVLGEKLTNAEGLAQTLGRIWCPIKGVNCKDLGENHFLFTFLQAAGKRRALEDGPWMFGKDLVVMAELDDSKSIDEMEFALISIWVRVMKLPFGMMNKATGEAIGTELGSYICMDLDEDGTAVGRYLRIKVKLDIRKPLMRGVTVYVGEKKDKPMWCPLEYEFLPDFCYNCGIIGHTDKMCEMRLASGEKQQYIKKLRCMPNRRRVEEAGDRVNAGKHFTSWRFGGSGSGSHSHDSGGKLSHGRSGSDAPSWRKDVVLKGGSSGGGRGREEEAEVSNPLNLKEKQHHEEISKRVLLVENVNETIHTEEKEGDKKVVNNVEPKAAEVEQKNKMIDVNSTMQDMHVDVDGEFPGAVEGKETQEVKERGSKGSKYKKIPRDIAQQNVVAPSLPESRKRHLEEEGCKGMQGKKMKGNNTNEKAGLSEQPCKDQ